MLTRTKPQEELDTERCMEKEREEKQKKAKERIKEPYEMLNKRKTLTTIARLKKAKEKALK